MLRKAARVFTPVSGEGAFYLYAPHSRGGRNSIIAEKSIPEREPRADKVELVEEITHLLDRSAGLIVTDYRGLTVAEKSDLTRRLREVNAEYHVVKNTLFKIAYGNRGDDPSEIMKGPSAVVFAFEDPVAPSKAALGFFQEKRKGLVKGGVVGGRVYDLDQITAISKLPARPVLMAQVVGAVQGPLAGLVGTLQGVAGGLVATLQAIHDQKSQA